MAQALAFEKVDKHGNPVKCYLDSTSCNPWKAKKPQIDTGVKVTSVSSDKGNPNFEGPEGSDLESDTKSDSDLVDMPPSNAEVSHLVDPLLGLNHVLFMVGC